MVNRFNLVAALAAVVAMFQVGVAWAQGAGECSGGVCGVPKTSGGAPCVGGVCSGGGCGGGSILINNTDEGDTYQYADDYDDDGIEDNFDNCPFFENKSQADTDGDKIGDACDICPSTPDYAQLDTDGDGIGDLCDADADNDGLDNGQDNCPFIANFEQVNTDLDTKGDACDDDDDDDGVVDGQDNCPLVANPLQEPPEELGSPKCDTDLDMDLVPDSRDNCPQVGNADQADLDADGFGDLCDGDLDGDQIANLKDNCPDLANPDQTDADRDGKGDSCDSRFCFVVNGDEKNCLDPTLTFQVYSPVTRLVTGQASRLRLFANRSNTPITYKWIVVKRPDESDAVVSNPKGAVRVSTPYEYHYLKGNIATFTADQPGEYQIKLAAELVFPDTVNPDFPQDASFVATLIAEGEPVGGCAVTGTGSAPVAGLLLLLGLLGLVTIAVRRR